MAEYIKRETAVRAVMAAKWVDGSDGAMAMEIVVLPAAADVAPVVHGEWIEDGYGYNHCAVCGWEWDEPESVSPFCLNCGAKMDGKRKDSADG